MAVPPIPVQTNLIDEVDVRQLARTAQKLKSIMSSQWQTFMRALLLAVNAAAQSLGTTALTTQGAAIVTTPLQLQTLAEGLYRVTWYLRITRAAGTSSSAQLTLSWTDGGVAVSSTQVAVTGNTTSTFQTGSLVVHVDAATDINYAVAYASVGAPTMQYSLSVVVEALPV